MITIKDKGNRSQIYIPRDGVSQNYITYTDLEELKNKISNEYTTKEHIDEKIGLIDNKLEEILG